MVNYNMCDDFINRLNQDLTRRIASTSFFIITFNIINIMPYDVGLYNRLAVFHEFHVLDKASRDKVMRGSTSGVKKIPSITSQKTVMQPLGIFVCTDCPDEPHLLPVLMKVKKF